MTPSETQALIDAAGGDTKFGELLAIDRKPGFQQRVNNWKRRGMPSKVVLENLPVIERLRRQLREADRGARRAAS